ncbi:hypothetical protein RN001_008503 [Aquatica leii]|uniref:Uncharacterized protein n=1 Tax=Aquatica leii TaxID=1421715 RepID=A0AAN7PZ74_9COLE|nr:hypothetical protein RN001_008503 [Aquatica leii]
MIDGWAKIKNDNNKFDKLVKANTQPSDDWKIFKIQRVFFETDDYQKAHKKIKLCEMYSDVQTTDIEDDVVLKKRNVPKPSRFLEDFDNGSQSSEGEYDSRNTIRRPPPFMVESRLPQASCNEEPSSAPALYTTTPSRLLENTFIVAFPFLNKTDFYDYPVKSCNLYIFVVKSLATVPETHSILQIMSKCSVLPLKNDLFASLPLLHTIDLLFN